MVRAQVMEGDVSYFDLAVGCRLSTMAQAVGPHSTTSWLFQPFTFILRLYLRSKKKLASRQKNNKEFGL